MDMNVIRQMTPTKVRLVNDGEELAEILRQDRKKMRHTSMLLFIAICVLVIVIVYSMLSHWMDWKLLSNVLQEHVARRREFDRPLRRAINIQNYELFIERYNRKYANPEETLTRYHAYVHSLEEVQRYNDRNQHLSGRYGENRFSDWSIEEFSKMLMPNDFKQRLRASKFIRKKLPEGLLKGDVIPEHFDWRPYHVITAVKTQNHCRSSWAFATTAAVESAYAIAHGELRDLSEQTLLDCGLESGTCEMGDIDKALLFIHNVGFVLRVDYPFASHRQNTCVSYDQDLVPTKMDVAHFLPKNEESIIDWLIHYGPVNVAINVTADVKAYKDGVYTPYKWECEHKIIGTHTMNIVGYGTNKSTNEKYWIVRNSWGSDWGVENGYVYFARGINACGIEDEPIGFLA